MRGCGMERRKSDFVEVTARGKEADMTQGLEEVRGIAQECGGDLAFLVNNSGGKTLHECWDSFARSFRKPQLTR